MKDLNDNSGGLPRSSRRGFYPSIKGSDVSLPEQGISAHRGANDTHPENTMAAFEEAVRCGTQQLEMDIHLTDDGELPVIHDSNVERTTNGSGEIERMSLDRIKSLDAGSWKDPKFSGEQIPLLDEVLEVMPDNIWLNLQLKGGREVGTAAAKKLLEYDRLHQAFFAADHEAAMGIRSVSRDILICNMNRQTELDRYVEETLQGGYDFIQFHHRFGMPSREQIQRLKQAGVRINYFRTNDPEELAFLYELGIDFPLVDDFHKMLEKARQLGMAE